MSTTRSLPWWCLPPVYAALALTAAGLVGCGDDATVPTGGSGAGGELAGQVLLDGLDGPTQLAIGPDGRWWLAQLNGGENEGDGQVLVFDPPGGDGSAGAGQVVVDGLDKPTGVAVFADELWIIERDRLTRGPLDGSNRQVVVDELVNNGRSQGTLTVDGDRLLFNTSGRQDDDGARTEGSGVLWSVDADGAVSEVATGFKHAYAHTRTADGELLTTEIGDGTYDGEPPPDELVVVTEGVDHGWPRCIGDNVPVAEYGAAAGDCAQAPSSLALFPPRATPTSVAMAPWDETLALVALWNTGEVVAVDLGESSTDRPIDSDVVYTGARWPQHLTVDAGAGDVGGVGDRLLLVDHDAGTVVELRPR